MHSEICNFVEFWSLGLGSNSSLVACSMIFYPCIVLPSALCLDESARHVLRLNRLNLGEKIEMIVQKVDFVAHPAA